MALTPEQIDAEAFARWGEMKGAPLAMCRGFARAIEAEVRKEYTELIQQLVEALEQLVACHEEPDCPAVAIGSEAITAGRARLEGKP